MTTKQTRRNHTAALKAKVAVARRGRATYRSRSQLKAQGNFPKVSISARTPCPTPDQTYVTQAPMLATT